MHLQRVPASKLLQSRVFLEAYHGKKRQKHTTNVTRENGRLRVAVGMSGGVDSAVSALLLKQSGNYEVTGVFMKNWDTLEESGGDCQADKEAADAERICNHIGVPFRHVNFVKEYWSEVFEPTLETYTLGQRIKQAGMAEKMYVVDKNLDNQVIAVCAGEHHPALYSETFFTHPPHWISERAPRELQNARHRLLECDYRSQNKMPLEKCALTFRMAGSSNWEYVSLGNGLTVSLANPQRALTAGQYAAFYQGEVCLGSAKIERVGPSLYTMNHNNCRTKILQSLSDKKSDSKGI